MFGLRVVCTILLLLPLADAASPEAGGGRCSLAPDGTCSSSSSPGTPGDSGTLLVQRASQVVSAAQLLHERAEKKPTPWQALLTLDGAIAAHVRSRRQTPGDIGTSVLNGIQAVMGALPDFMAQPMRWSQGIDRLGSGLLVAISGSMDEYRESGQYEAFETGWNDFFTRLSAEGDEIRVDLDEFVATGEGSKLMTAMTAIFSLVTDSVLTFMPQQTANEIGIYFEAVSDVLGSVGEGWAAFERGDTTVGVEVLYQGIRSGVDRLIPESIKNDATFGAIMGTLDNTIGNLTQTVNAFRNQLLTAECCWKSNQLREKERPRICRDNFAWNGEQWCFPIPTAPTEGSSSLLSGGITNSLSLNDAARRKGDGSAAGKGMPTGSLPALCDDNGDFPNKHGHWCYKACPTGFRIEGNTRCKTECQGEYPVDDNMQMCGKNQGVLIQAAMNMAMTGLSSAISLWTNINSMVENGGIDATPLTNSINALVDFGQAFAYPQCRDRIER